MTDYADLPVINALYAEQAQVSRAIDVLDNAGTVTRFVVEPTADTQGGMLSPVAITMIAPSQSLLAGVRSSLIQRHNEINRELAGYGVTDGPPDHSAGPADTDA